VWKTFSGDRRHRSGARRWGLLVIAATVVSVVLVPSAAFAQKDSHVTSR